MKERGIIFNTEMVRAIIDGRKTQTRRVMKSQPVPSKTKDGDYWFPCNKIQSMVHVSDFIPGNGAVVDMHEFYSSCCPYGGVGDRLWVRETFQVGLCTESSFAYNATHSPSDLEEGWNEVIKWKPSIHMPRWASRITLEITDVRVEQLNHISEEDSKAEGIRMIDDNFGNGPAYCDYTLADLDDHAEWYNRASDSFISLWQSIYGAESWLNNPWVWVIEFKRV